MNKELKDLWWWIVLLLILILAFIGFINFTSIFMKELLTL